MPILPLHGHGALRDRLADMITRSSLPQSLLLHGHRGVGKQRLALWLGAALLCTGDAPGIPCGRCQSCRYTAELTHPDLHWFFPRPRLKDSDADADAVRDDYREAIADRVKYGGLYEPASGNEGIFVSTVRALVHEAAMSPALGRRKVFVIGDAERMVPQEGSEQAANALLKLLEEPPTDTTIVLTSSEPGGLLPTVRSRIVAFRVAPLAEGDLRSFIADPLVKPRLARSHQSMSEEDLVRAAAGAPGQLVGHSGASAALANARRLLEAATRGDRIQQLRTALGQGAARARGSFSDTLDALTLLLHERVRSAADSDEAASLAAARAVAAVEQAKELAGGNVSPQLVTAELMRTLSALGSRS